MFIYGLIDPRTDCLRYVGKTTNLAKRLSKHCNPQRSDRSHRGCWLRGIKNIGLRPSMVVLEEVEDRDTTLVECFWIASLRAAGADLVNACDGGEGGAVRTGHTSTEQHRAKIAKSHIGMRPDEATRLKMRWTPERRAKVAAAAAVRHPHPRHIKKHATWGSYALGCRCTGCTTFSREYQRQQATKESVSPPHARYRQHGTTSMYQKGCRCLECSAASTRYLVEWRRKQKASNTKV